MITNDFINSIKLVFKQLPAEELLLSMNSWYGQWLAGLTHVVKFGYLKISAAIVMVSFETRQKVMCFPCNITCSTRRVNKGSLHGSWFKCDKNERSWNSTGSDITSLSVNEKIGIDLNELISIIITLKLTQYWLIKQSIFLIYIAIIFCFLQSLNGDFIILIIYGTTRWEIRKNGFR